MKKRWLCFLLSFSVGLYGCIQVPTTETTTISLNQQDRNVLISQETSTFKVESLVYQPNVLPLETFFKELKSGKLKEAIKKIDVRYRPSNLNNQVLYDFMNQGYVPALVRVTNKSAQPLHISLKNFKLTNSQTKINPRTAPQETKQFNPEALAANAYNVTVALIVAFAILLFLAILTQGHGISIPGGDSPSSHSKFMNSLEKTVRYDYQKLLIGDEVLQPNSTREGLLFFKVENASDLENLTLVFSDELGGN